MNFELFGKDFMTACHFLDYKEFKFLCAPNILVKMYPEATVRLMLLKFHLRESPFKLLSINILYLRDSTNF